MLLASMRGRRSSGSMAARIGVVFLIAATCLITTEGARREKVYYLDPEHLNVTYWNPKWYQTLNATTQRFGRKDPIHYLHIHMQTLMPFDNNYLIDVYFYEYRSNQYHRSFVEFHYKWCDLMLRDNIFGPFFNKYVPKTCPMPPGYYHLVNMSVPDLPLLRTFPFQKGRLFFNATIISSHGVRSRICDVYTDVTIKQRWR